MSESKIININGYDALIDENVDCGFCKMRRKCNLLWMKKCSDIIGKGNALKPAN